MKDKEECVEVFFLFRSVLPLRLTTKKNRKWVSEDQDQLCLLRHMCVSIYIHIQKEKVDDCIDCQIA